MFHIGGLKSVRALAPILLVVTSLLVGCGDDDGGEEGGSEDGARVVLLSVSGHEAFRTIEIGAEQAAKELGVTLDVRRQTGFEAQAQVSLVNSVAATRPDAILISAFDRTALEAPLRVAADRGSKVVMIDSNVDNPDFAATFIGSDYVKLGQQAGQALVEVMGESGTVLPFGELPGNLSLDQYLDGFAQVMESHPGIAVLDTQYHEQEANKAASITRSTLSREPDLSGINVGPIFGGPQGVVSALRSAGQLGKVKVVGLDASLPAQEMLRNGDIQAIVSSKMGTLGKRSVELALDAIEGKTLPREILLEGCVLTKETIDAPENKPCIYVAPEK